MLQFTKQVDYGLQLIVALVKAKKNEPLSLRKFSKDSNISFLFLQRIARALRQAGIVEADKGAYGGYFLKLNPSKIKIKDIIEAVDGKYGVSNCFKDYICPKKNTCEARKIFCIINNDFIKYLSEHTLHDFTKNYETASKV